MFKFAALALFLSVTLSVASSFAAQADPVSFSKDWREQDFFRLASNTYQLGGSTLGIASDSSVSVVYSALPTSQWGARRATWHWEVSQSVPPTDLTQKGGDDRNVSMYFVFMDRASAEKAGPRPKLRALLGNKNARMLVYTWGGKHARGQMLASPYLGDRGKTVIRRPAGTGSFDESVDLVADYAKAFGGAPDALVGIAVSADSDDTGSIMRGSVSKLALE